MTSAAPSGVCYHLRNIKRTCSRWQPPSQSSKSPEGCQLCRRRRGCNSCRCKGKGLAICR
jgi:hypothetical protein